MNSIGFQNFRKFKSLPEIEFGGITFLVGPNNSGKSTVVKALLLVSNYFKAENYKRFYFGNQTLEKVNIINYGRAKNHEADINQIKFHVKIGDILVNIELTGEDDKAYAEVQFIQIHDYATGLTFTLNFLTRLVHIQMEKEATEVIEDQKIKEGLALELENILNQLNNVDLSKTSLEYIELLTLKDKTQRNIDLLNKEGIPFPIDISFIQDEITNATKLYDVFGDLITSGQAFYKKYYDLIQQGEDAHPDFAHYKVFNEFGFNKVEDIMWEIFAYLENTSIHYLGASVQKPSTYFAINDRNNSLAQAIYRYKQSNIAPGEPEHMFILKWIKAFEIGENFLINKVDGGEGYIIKIEENKKQLHLSDKGVGTVQLISLILKLATSIRLKRFREKSNPDFKSNDILTIIGMEEPELNLHPALQSKLADLFLEAHQNFGIELFIETHSEYIIRKSQLLVKENELERPPNINPFKVIYFDIDRGPRNISYRDDGKLVEDFGKGFYDESINLTLKLL